MELPGWIGSGDTPTMIFLAAVVLYATLGLITSVAFVTFGVTRVLPHPVPVTVGARILLLPGAAVLWPYVLIRWVKSGRAR